MWNLENLDCLAEASRIDKYRVKWGYLIQLHHRVESNLGRQKAKIGSRFIQYFMRVEILKSEHDNSVSERQAIPNPMNVQDSAETYMSH